MKMDSHLVLMSVSKLASRIDVLKIITKASKPFKEFFCFLLGDHIDLHFWKPNLPISIRNEGVDTANGGKYAQMTLFSPRVQPVESEPCFGFVLHSGAAIKQTPSGWCGGRFILAQPTHFSRRFIVSAEGGRGVPQAGSFLG